MWNPWRVSDWKEGSDVKWSGSFGKLGSLKFYFTTAKFTAICYIVKNTDFIYEIEATSCRVMIKKDLEAEQREHLHSFHCQAMVNRMNMTFRSVNREDWIEVNGCY